MSFTLSGSVITQSGTDTSLAGLAGIAGVTTVGTGDKVTYVLASRQIVVTGALTFDPEKESLEFDENCTSVQLTVSGASAVLTIGAAGKGRPWPVMAVYCRKREVNWSTRQVYVHTGGVLRHYYGVIHCQGAVEILSTAGYCTFGGLMHFSLTQYAEQYGRFYPGRSAEYLSTFEVTGNGVQPIGGSTVSNMTISDGRTIGLHGASYGSLATPYEVSGVTLINASVYPWAESVWSLVGMAAGGNVVKTGGGVSASTKQLIRTYGLANITVTAAGAAVVGAKVFSRDTNNGSRSSFSCGTPSATYDGVPDTTVLSTTVSGGATGSTRYLLQAWSRNNVGAAVTDWRTLTPGANTRQIRVKGYTIKPVGVVVDLTAAGTLEQPVFSEDDTAVTLPEAAAGALTTLATLDDLYDAAKHWSVQDANLEYPTAATQPITSSGGAVDLGDMDLVIDATAAAAFAIDTGTHTVTVKASTLAAGSKHTRLTTTTTGTVSTTNGATITALYTDSAGTHVTITAASLVSGSRVQIYNATDSTEILNTTLGSTGLAYATTWTADKTIRLRADHPDYLPLEATGILTASGLTFLSEQAEDTVYVGNGIDGSTVTEFTADGLAIHVDVDDPDGYTLVQRLYAWLQHYQTTSAGIASAFFGAMVASDSANYVIDQDKADIHLDNVAASPLMIVGGHLTRRDGSTVIAAASGSIQMDPGRAYVAPGGAAITVPEGERVILLQASGAHIARG